jgi:hypothetical protein
MTILQKARLMVAVWSLLVMMALVAQMEIEASLLHLALEGQERLLFPAKGRGPSTKDLAESFRRPDLRSTRPCRTQLVRRAPRTK